MLSISLYQNSYIGKMASLCWNDPLGLIEYKDAILAVLYKKTHCGDKTILRPSYLHNGISFIGKTTSLYWIRALVACLHPPPDHSL